MPIPYVPSAEEVAANVMHGLCLVVGCGLAIAALVGGFLYIIAGISDIKKSLAKKLKENKEN